MAKLAVLILTYNEELHIEECMKSAAFADEIVVVDSGSTDRTVELATSGGARAVTHPMTDGFAAQRNFALLQSDAEWIMFLDADERITPELAAEIKSTVRAGTEAGYYIPRRNRFMGRWIKSCGWSPDLSLRLFIRNAANYTGIVHESLHIDGKVGRLKNCFEHLAYTNLEQYLQKMNNYTTLAARGLQEKGKTTCALEIAFRPVFAFIKMYILRKGFTEGLEGFIISVLSAVYVFLKYGKLYYLQRNSQ
ncbi:MAG: glycosyl transferase [Firmicutes bacterium]|nr:glycosyl transferase [Bacillota bacterium]